METSPPSYLETNYTIYRWYIEQSTMVIPSKMETRRKELETIYESVSKKLEDIHSSSSNISSSSSSTPDIRRFREAYLYFVSTLEKEMEMEKKRVYEQYVEIMSQRQKFLFQMKRKRVHQFFQSPQFISNILYSTH
jgi:organic radical activating enzyme